MPRNDASRFMYLEIEDMSASQSLTLVKLTMKWTKFALVALFGVILANEFPYSYWRPFHEVTYNSIQPIQPILQERQYSVNPIFNAIRKFFNGIQSRQFAAGIGPVSYILAPI